MKIVVIGDGKVGRSIVENTCREGHEVVVIDKNPKVIEELVNQYEKMLKFCVAKRADSGFLGLRNSKAKKRYKNIEKKKKALDNTRTQ